MSVVLQVAGLSKSYGEFIAVDAVDFEVEQGTFLTLLGPSGSGKTTTLRMIGGFEAPSEGRVYLSGADVTETPPYARDVNTVFQNYALFPHMTVYQNIAFGLEAKGLRRAEIRERAMEALALVRLDAFHQRSLQGLSGGEQQRVALARAFVLRPTVLLLDEPLGALDLKLRRHMQVELKSLQRALGIAFVYVTHDQEEALSMSDRIIVMNHGHIEQAGDPEHIYQDPKTAFVAEFLGDANVLSARVLALDEPATGWLRLDCAGEHISCAHRGWRDVIAGQDILLSVRSEHITLNAAADESANRLRGRVEHAAFYGAFREYTVTRADGQTIRIRSLAQRSDRSYRAGETVTIGWEPENAVVLMR